MNLKRMRIAFIEPNGADVQWFRHSAMEAGFSVEVVHYSTGVLALKEWTERADCTADLIVVADVLPMLTPGEFINALWALHPDLRVAITGEQIPVPVQVNGTVERYTKPLSAHDVRQMCGYATFE